jgi:hypothetical protein
VRKRLYLFDAPAQRFFIIVKKSELPFDGHLLVMVAQMTVRPRRHPVAGVAGKEIEPFPIPMIIEELGFLIVELLDFKLKFGSYPRRFDAHSLCPGSMRLSFPSADFNSGSRPDRRPRQGSGRVLVQGLLAVREGDGFPSGGRALKAATETAVVVVQASLRSFISARHRRK